ncbi:hypothetical protein Pla22_28840 [Rubripirellula amarantea]|uniref:Uncharacterized protein n=1 Tax=Rubripirellula amarantea TaxID=2527999 RepID=A0A5C5WH67_9BACT|nr:hypothetical protein Pla22_28840 [Rubripirellula amarantea]
MANCCENSDVSFVVKSVAVAVTCMPVGIVAVNVVMNVALPLPSVVTSIDPR